MGPFPSPAFTQGHEPGRIFPWAHWVVLFFPDSPIDRPDRAYRAALIPGAGPSHIESMRNIFTVIGALLKTFWTASTARMELCKYRCIRLDVPGWCGSLS